MRGVVGDVGDHTDHNGSLSVEGSYSMAGVVLVAATVDFALPGVTLRAGVIRRSRPVTTFPWQH